MSRQHRILWSPTGQPKFLVGSTDLRLYQYTDIPTRINHSVRDLRHSTGKLDRPEFNMLAVNSDVSLMKCFAWSPSQQADDIVAIGLTNGRAVLVRMQSVQSAGDASINDLSISGALGEFLPRHSRACNVLAFSNNEPALLAAGLDKVRNDYCLLLWDTEVQARLDSRFSAGTNRLMDYDATRMSVDPLLLSNNTTESTHSINQMGDHVSSVIRHYERPNYQVMRPLQQYGSSEAVTSVCWLPNQPKTLVAAMGLKWLRLYDIRAPSNSPPRSVYSTRAVYGLTADPFNDYRFASFTDDGFINVWDTRNQTEPLLTLNAESKNGITQISFSPQRSSLLAVLPKESKSLKFWDLKETFSDSKEPAELEVWRSRSAKPSTDMICSFTWIPLEKNSILNIGKTGTIERIWVKEPMKLTWSCNNYLAISDENSGVTERSYKFHLDSQVQKTLQSDILHCMRQLSKANYGMFTPGNLSQIDKQVQEAWNWVNRTLGLTETFAQKSDQTSLFTGFQSLFSHSSFRNLSLAKEKQRDIDAVPKKSNPANKRNSTTAMAYTAAINSTTSFTPTSSKENQQAEITAEPSSFIFPTEFVNERRIALSICGWGLCGSELEKSILTLEKNQEYERAAAWALFSGDVAKCVSLLNSSNDERLKILSAAVAGYVTFLKPPNLTGQEGLLAIKSSQEICRSLSLELKEPYLRVIFAYISSGGKIQSVLEEKDLPLRDKLGIALRFLQDTELVAYVNKTTKKYVMLGNLEGIILTGYSRKSAIPLFRQYLDNTGDIQSVALLCSFWPPDLFENAETFRTVTDWVECYRELLDRWKLFHARCRFDIARRKFFRESEISGRTPEDLIHELSAVFSVPPQIYVSCTFCNQSISKGDLMLHPRSKPNLNRSDLILGTQPGSFGQIQLQRVKNIACPSCRKPLQRCAICLLNCGTLVDSANHAECSSSNPIDSWFTWCQTCRHGGHMLHISEWFDQHTVCPVSDCDCRCNNL